MCSVRIFLIGRKGPNSITLSLCCLPDQEPLARKESWRRQKATQLCSLPRVTPNIAAWGRSFSAPHCRLGTSEDLALRICLRDLSGKSKKHYSSSWCGIRTKPTSQHRYGAKADGVPAPVTLTASTGWKQSGKQIKRGGNTS